VSVIGDLIARLQEKIMKSDTLYPHEVILQLIEEHYSICILILMSIVVSLLITLGVGYFVAHLNPVRLESYGSCEMGP
jgi:hypothetical protein